MTLAPNWELRVERPWHKYAAYLFATGKTVHAIALQLGKGDAADRKSGAANLVQTTG